MGVQHASCGGCQQEETDHNYSQTSDYTAKEGREEDGVRQHGNHTNNEGTKQPRHAAHYKGRKEQIAAQFTFGKKFKKEEKDKLLCLLYAYKDMFTLTPKAPPLIEGTEHALYFRYDDPFPVRRKTSLINNTCLTFVDDGCVYSKEEEEDHNY